MGGVEGFYVLDQTWSGTRIIANRVEDSFWMLPPNSLMTRNNIMRVE